MQGNEVFNAEILAKNARNWTYVITTDACYDYGNTDTNAYMLFRVCDGVIELLLSKTEGDENKFKKDVEDLARLFNATTIKFP